MAQLERAMCRILVLPRQIRSLLGADNAALQDSHSLYTDGRLVGSSDSTESDRISAYIASRGGRTTGDAARVSKSTRRQSVARAGHWTSSQGRTFNTRVNNGIACATLR